MALNALSLWDTFSISGVSKDADILGLSNGQIAVAYADRVVDPINGLDGYGVRVEFYEGDGTFISSHTVEDIQADNRSNIRLMETSAGEVIVTSQDDANQNVQGRLFENVNGFWGTSTSEDDIINLPTHGYDQNVVELSPGVFAIAYTNDFAGERDFEISTFSNSGGSLVSNSVIYDDVTGVARDGDIIATSGGRYVSTHLRSDGGTVSVVATIGDATGFNRILIADNIATKYTPTVTELANGRFVVIWEQEVNASESTIQAAILEKTSATPPSLTEVVSPFIIADSPGFDAYPQVLALPNGDFVLGYIEGSFDTGQEDFRLFQYDSSGVEVGSFEQTGTFGELNMSLTGDGRILVALEDTSGVEPTTDLLIVDPRSFEYDNTYTDGDDEIWGYRGIAELLAPVGDVLVGGGGDDELHGLRGDDVLVGQSGNDRLFGGLENDTYLGGSGDDRMFEGGGVDIYNGGSGFDTVEYSDGDITINMRKAFKSTGSATDDIFIDVERFLINSGGDSGFQFVASDDGIEVTLDADGGVFGGAGMDTFEAFGSAVAEFYGGGGNDTLRGNASSVTDDKLIGNNGDDTLEGRWGNDRLEGGNGADILNGGAGDKDVASYVQAGTGVTINLSDTTQNTGHAAGDTYIAIERFLGSEFGDTFTGSSGAVDDWFRGLGGDDTAVMGQGNDFARGDDGNDNLAGNLGDDTLIGDAGEDTLNGGGGMDRLAGGADKDNLTGGGAADTFVFNEIGPIDRIFDFVNNEDKIELENAVFTGLTAGNGLSAAQFEAGSSAVGTSAQIIFEAATGYLYYDSDGTGAAAQQAFARLVTGTIDADDFIIV